MAVQTRLQKRKEEEKKDKEKLKQSIVSRDASNLVDGLIKAQKDVKIYSRALRDFINIPENKKLLGEDSFDVITKYLEEWCVNSN